MHESWAERNILRDRFTVMNSLQTVCHAFESLKPWSEKMQRFLHNLTKLEMIVKHLYEDLAKQRTLESPGIILEI